MRKRKNLVPWTWVIVCSGLMGCTSTPLTNLSTGAQAPTVKPPSDSSQPLSTADDAVSPSTPTASLPTQNLEVTPVKSLEEALDTVMQDLQSTAQLTATTRHPAPAAIVPPTVASTSVLPLATSAALPEGPAAGPSTASDTARSAQAAISKPVPSATASGNATAPARPPSDGKGTASSPATAQIAAAEGEKRADEPAPASQDAEEDDPSPDRGIENERLSESNRVQTQVTNPLQSAANRDGPAKNPFR